MKKSEMMRFKHSEHKATALGGGGGGGFGKKPWGGGGVGASTRSFQKRKGRLPSWGWVSGPTTHRPRRKGAQTTDTQRNPMILNTAPDQQTQTHRGLRTGTKCRARRPLVPTDPRIMSRGTLLAFGVSHSGSQRWRCGRWLGQREWVAPPPLPFATPPPPSARRSPGGGGGSPSDGLPPPKTSRKFFFGAFGAWYFLCFLGQGTVSRCGGAGRGVQAFVPGANQQPPGRGMRASACAPVRRPARPRALECTRQKERSIDEWTQNSRE